MAIKNPPKKPLKKPTSPPPLPAPQPSAPAKKFKVVPWQSNEGEKILIYGDTGIGKSSLGILAPTPVFLGLDEGASKLRHPETNEPVDHIVGLETFADVRAALQDISLFEKYETVVIDTVTILQDWAEADVVANITTDKGIKVKNLLGYGYNKGYKHLYNTMKLILQDCDNLARQGKHIILIAQSINNNIANPGGEDYLRHGPRLHVDRSWDIQALYCEWSDHIFRLDYADAFVSKDKKISGSTERAIYVQPELYFRAKSRTIEEPVISFEDKADDSIWQFLFGEKNNECSTTRP